MMAANLAGCSEESSDLSDIGKSADSEPLSVPNCNEENVCEKNEDDENESGEKLEDTGANKCNEEKKWLTALKQFHNGRFLQILHLSPDTTEEDIKDALSFLDIKNVDISKVSSSAKVILAEAQNCDPLLSPNFPSEIKGKLVTINHSSSENFLCVSSLPSDYTEEEFHSLAEKFGPLEKCFLIYCHETDKSKGYGLVEYCSRTVACQARNLLHYKQLVSGTIHCDWLDHRLVTYSSLYSKCIFVDCLPTSFRDLSVLRKAFSCIAQPLYCQLGMINGQPIGFGIIEYNTPEEASQTQEKMNGSEFENTKIKVYLTIPGVPAVKLLDRLITKLVNKKINQKGLLPRPFVSPSLLQQIQLANLLKPQVIQPVRSLLSNNVRLPAGTIQPNISVPSPYFPAVITQPPVMTPAGLSLSNGLCSPLSLLLPKLCEQLPQFAHPQPLGNLQKQIQQRLLQEMQKQISAGQAFKAMSSSPSLFPLNTNMNQRQVQQQPLQTAMASPIPQVNEQVSSVFDNLGNKQFQHFASPQQERTADSNFIPNSSQKSTELGPQNIVNNILNSVVSTRSRTVSDIKNGRNSLSQSHTVSSTNLVSSIYNNVLNSPMNSGKIINNEKYDNLSFSNQSVMGSMQVQKMQGNSSQQNSPSFSRNEGNSTFFRSFSQGDRMSQASFSFRSANKSPFFNRLQGMNESTVTPIGQKRKLHHLLPSPEASPENGYIGQHSQGIGGHYADSYLYSKKYKPSPS